MSYQPVLLAIPVLLAVFALPARADRLAVAEHPLYQEECASCHMAYPPQLLDAHSWQHVMNGLPRHFGSDASLDDKRRTTIADFLGKNAGSRKTGITADASGQPLLRITDTAYFKREHRKIDAATWRRASIKSPANCTACHAQAATGDYSERSITIPK